MCFLRVFFIPGKDLSMNKSYVWGRRAKYNLEIIYFFC